MSEKQRNLYIHNSPASLPARGLTSLPAFTPSTVDRLGGGIADCVWDNNTCEKTFFFFTSVLLYVMDTLASAQHELSEMLFWLPFHGYMTMLTLSIFASLLLFFFFFILFYHGSIKN